MTSENISLDKKYTIGSLYYDGSHVIKICGFAGSDLYVHRYYSDEFIDSTLVHHRSSTYITSVPLTPLLAVLLNIDYDHINERFSLYDNNEK